MILQLHVLVIIVKIERYTVVFKLEYSTGNGSWNIFVGIAYAGFIYVLIRPYFAWIDFS